jgi:hypothetical protein
VKLSGETFCRTVLRRTQEKLHLSTACTWRGACCGGLYCSREALESPAADICVEFNAKPLVMNIYLRQRLQAKYALRSIQSGDQALFQQRM